MEQNPGVDESESSSSVKLDNYSRIRRVALSLFYAIIAGLFASIVSVVIMGILRLYAGIPSPVELAGDFSLKHIDVYTFIHLLGVFNFSKTKPLGLALAGMVLLGILSGIVYALLVRIQLPAAGYRVRRREWLVAAVFVLAMTLLGSILFWDELRQSFIGFPVDEARWVSIAGLLLDFAGYGLALALSYRLLLPKQKLQNGVDEPVQKRRLLLSRAGIAALGVGGVGAAYGLVQNYLNQYAGYDGQRTAVINGYTPAITPTSEHYTVTQNPIDPKPDINLWSLELAGLVKNPGSYTFDEFQQLPSTSRPITLECISNSVGDHLIGTAIWQGVPLKTLLDRHGGPLDSASYVAFYSVDGYNMSLPLKDVLDADPLLAFRMNGAELSYKHGYPVRVLMPGRYGEENPKWLTRIALTDAFVGGLYSDQGWYHGPLHTMSRIDRPTGHVPSGQKTQVGGIAFAGIRGIKKVEVTTDGELTWHEATLQPPLSPDTWVLWTYDWTPSAPGTYRILSRATDGTGAVQTSVYSSVVPDGANGYPLVSVQVS